MKEPDPLSISTLGVLGVGDDDGPAHPGLVVRRKPFALLVYLLLGKESGAYHQRDALAAMFWPESTQRRARASLRQALTIIERHLGPAFERRGSEEVRATPGAFRLDVHEFLDDVREGDWLAAIGRYHGPFLQAVHIADSRSFERWVDGWQIQVADAHRQALNALEAERDMGAPAGSVSGEGARAGVAARAPADGGARAHEDAAGPRAPRRWLTAAALVVVASAVALGWAVQPRTAPAGGGATRVLVAPFRVDADRSPATPLALSIMIGDQIALVDSVDVVSGLSLVWTDDDEVFGDAADEARLARVAERLRAEVLVRGAILAPRPGSWEVMAEVVDARSGRVLGTPILSAGTDVPLTTLVQDVGARAATRIAERYQPLQDMRGTLGAAPDPPPFPAYLELAEAMRAFGHGSPQRAEEHARRALAIAPGFVAAQIEVAVQRANRDAPHESDSIVRTIRAREPHLSVWDRERLTWLEAALRGDRATRLAVARRRDAEMPSYQLAYELSELGRVTESLDVLERPGAVRPASFRGRELWLRAVNLHRLGRHAEEAAAADRHRRELPEESLGIRMHARALAAKADEAGLRRLMDEAREANTESRLLPALVAFEAGTELVAHGWADEGRRWLERSLSLYPDVSSTPRAANVEYLRVMMAAERWDEARTALSTLLEGDPENLELLGSRAVLEARDGDRATAERIYGDLAAERPFSHGARALWQARIAAALGWDDRIAGLLALAVGRGAARPAWVHAFPEWRYLTDRRALDRWLAVS